jgi:hypothetical protein
MVIDFKLHVPPMRFVIVHYHVFKNAGSTIESILEREFGDKFACLHGTTPDTVLDREHLVDFLRDHPGVLAISSHHLRYPLPEIRGVALFDLCFLRHPLSRLQSMYSYFRMARTSDPLSEMATQYSSREFFEQMTAIAPHLISNVQVLQLARAGRFTRPAGGQDLARAIEIVREMSLPGVVEMFDESLICMGYFLQPAFPGIRLEYVVKNASQFNTGGLESEAERFRVLWGERLYSKLTRLNQFDIELYQAARDEIQRRFEIVPDANQRLLELRSRSDVFQKAVSEGCRVAARAVI